MAISIREHSVSLTTLPSLNPSLSTTGPPRTDARIPPIAMTPAVIPTLAALPVVTRTNHGSANVVMLLPIEEMRLAPNKEKIGRPRASDASCLVPPGCFSTWALPRNSHGLRKILVHRADRNRTLPHRGGDP